MAVLKRLFETGKLTLVVDRTYLLSEVSEAIRYLEVGHAQGKGVIPCEGTRRKTLVATRLTRMSPATTDQALADSCPATPYLRGSM
jgi:Zinc-binding dehydrogenase